MTTQQSAASTVIRGEVRLRSWDRLSHGLYAAAAGRTVADELRAWSLVLPPTAAFTHLTAAEYHGWWLPAPIPHPVFAAVPVHDRLRRPGLFACRHPEPGPHHVIDGLRVTTAAETLLACARDLGILDLVIMGDSALRLGQCSIAELKLAAGRRRRGGPLLRTVIPLLDGRSESAWESVMRVLHRAAEIEVVPQREIFTESGDFVARADLWLVGTRRIHEYDGAVHRDPDAHRRDLDRERRIVRAGWQRLGFTSTDLLSQAAGIIADADQLLGRRWSRRRVEAWRDLVEHSLYGRAGRARAYRQWQRTEPPPKTGHKPQL